VLNFQRKLFCNCPFCKPDGESDYGWVFPLVMQQGYW